MQAIEAMDTEGESLEAGPDLQSIIGGSRLSAMAGSSGRGGTPGCARTGPESKKSRK